MGGNEFKVPISEEETARTLRQTVHIMMGLSASEMACLFQSDGTPIDEGVALTAQGVHPGDELCVTVQAAFEPLTDENIKHAVKMWCNPDTREEAHTNFGPIHDWNVTAVTC